MMSKIKQFFLERLFNGIETVFDTLFYILGWVAVIVLLSLHFAASHFIGLSFDLSELVWIISIPASFSSLGQYIGRALRGVFLPRNDTYENKSSTNERIASLVGIFLSAGFVTAAIHFKCVDANFVSSSSATMGWEYMVATLPLVANAIIAGCGYIGRVVDHFTKRQTIIDVLRYAKNKITGQPTEHLLTDLPPTPPGIKNYFKSCFKDYESTFRTVGFVLGITLGIVLIATGTALLPFSGGSSIALHVLACALFVFISGRTFSAMGKYVGKSADCMLDQKKRPLNEQIFSVIGLGVGLAVSVVLAPLHKLGASILVNKLADKAAGYVTVGIPLMMSTVAAGFAYFGKFLDNLAYASKFVDKDDKKPKTFIDVLEKTKVGKAFGWLKNKIFGPKSQSLSQKIEESASPASEKKPLSKLGGSRSTSPVTIREKASSDNQSDAPSYSPVLQPVSRKEAPPMESDVNLQCGIVCTP